MSAHIVGGAPEQSIRTLQRRLARQGYAPGPIDGRFGPSTRRAVLRFQEDAGLLADGIPGPRTLAALAVCEPATCSVLELLDPERVKALFPYTPRSAIAANLPGIKAGLAEFNLGDKAMTLMALATIRAECEGFEPVCERPSTYSCSPGGSSFDLYDGRTDLGNLGAPDGFQYRGRGFVQLTGRANYRRMGRLIGLGDRLEQEPDLAGDKEIAGRLLAAFLATRELPIKEALLEGNLRQARRLVNGGSHGLGRFIDCYKRGERLFAHLARSQDDVHTDAPTGFPRLQPQI